MKISSSLLKAMLISATVGAVTTSCKTTQQRRGDNDNYQIQSEEQVGLLGRIRGLFVRDTFICEACGKG
jgi:hypothetical protein